MGQVQHGNDSRVPFVSFPTFHLCSRCLAVSLTPTLIYKLTQYSRGNVDHYADLVQLTSFALPEAGSTGQTMQDTFDQGEWEER